MTASVPVIRLLIGEDTYPLDMNRIMATEAMALEDDWGLKVAEFVTLVTSGDPPMRVVAAMVWLARTRAIAEAKGLTFPEAKKLLPPATFDVDLVALKIEGDEPLPENPTESGTRTKGTRTTPATSAQKRKKAG